jgi:hypothetical protein
MERRTQAIAAFSLLLLFHGTAWAADRIDAALQSAVDGFGASGGTPVVSLGNFTYADKKIGSAFSRYLSEKLGTILTRSLRFRYFNREKLDEILKAAELSMGDLFDASTAVPVNLKGIEAVLSGTFFDAGTVVKVFLELQDVGSGASRARTEVDLPKTDIPAGVPVLPENLAGALSVLDELGSIQSSDAKDFKVKIWTDRGDGGTYRDGEQLVVNFFAGRDCYIRIFHVDVNGKMSLIFPNPYFADNKVTAKRIYKIPDSSYPFTFDLGAPFGTEFIKVVASTVPFTDRLDAFEDLGKAAKTVATRGLNITARDRQVTEGILSYTILK